MVKTAFAAILPPIWFAFTIHFMVLNVNLRCKKHASQQLQNSNALSP